MPDISKCNGTGCPLKEDCYRYKCKPDEYWQTYFVNVPYTEDGGCNYFWDINMRRRNDER